jgi:hypothetical protein
MQPVALVFRRVGVAWKLAIIVNHSDIGAPHGRRYETGTGTNRPVVLGEAAAARLERLPADLRGRRQQHARHGERGRPST